jgi:hypothetical protein
MSGNQRCIIRRPVPGKTSAGGDTSCTESPALQGPDKIACPRNAAMSNSCPILVPLASIAVFWLPPESRKYLILLRRDRFESYSAHHPYAA